MRRRRGDAAAVRTLLKQGADVSTAHPDGMTPLHWAAERGDAAMADALIPRRRQRDGRDAARRLHAAPPRRAHRQRARACARCSRPARRSTAPTASGATALHLAAAVRQRRRDQRAARRGRGRERARTTRTGQTPLIFAVSQGHVDAMKVLIKRGADVNLATKADRPARSSRPIDRQASTMRRQVLTAMVPPGAQPTPAQDQTAVAGRA